MFSIRLIEAYTQGEGVCGSYRHIRTVSCDSRDHNRSLKYQKLYTLVYSLIV